MQARTLLAGCLVSLLATAASAQSLTDTSLTATTFRSGFTAPTGFTFLPDGRLMVIEKDTGLVKLLNSAGTTTATALNLNVNNNSERGLLGIALDPNFATNQAVYLYYSVNSTAADSATDSQWVENRVSKFTLSGSSLGSEVRLEGFARDAAQANGPNHNGGPIMFDGQGKLLGITGDLNRARLEQNQTATTGASAGVGGLYRLETNGAPAAGNPFLSNTNTTLRKWYAYGVRNSFGMAIDPVNGAIWDTENGPESYDEINRVSAGFNSGWNDIMGPDSRDAQNVSDLTMIAGASYSDPELSFLQPIGITDMAFLHNFTFDATYENAVVFGGINGTNDGHLHIARLNAARDGFVVSGNLTDLVVDNDTERNSIAFGTGFGGTTDIQVGPDHALYVMSYTSGALYRITPTNTAFLLGDMDGNGRLDNFDIEFFEQALAQPQAYLSGHPTLKNYKMRGDINGDGEFNNFDISPFEHLLTAGPLGAAVPEPSTAVLFSLGGLLLIAARARAFRRRS